MCPLYVNTVQYLIDCRFCVTQSESKNNEDEETKILIMSIPMQYCYLCTYLSSYI